MRLKGQLYQIRRLNHSDDGRLHAIVQLLTDHDIYKGHFPGHPVLPGVCTLTIIKDCLEKAFRLSGDWKTIKECKFLDLVQPSKDLLLTLDFELQANHCLHGTVRRSENDKIILKLKAIWEPKELR